MNTATGPAIVFTATMKSAQVDLANMAEIQKWMDGQHVEFEQGLQKVHRKSVFEILIYWLRVCPVLTGRLRGSLTVFLDKYGKQSSYAKYLADDSLVSGGSKGKSTKNRKTSFQSSAVDEGKRDGVMAEGAGGMTTTVGTNVVYAGKVDETTHHFQKTVVRGQAMYNANFENYLAAAANAGWIPKASAVSDKPADDPGGPGTAGA